ncbi:hypothetical protein RUM44_003342 [Polyplax serrata]|uniref:C3H1-type domain-containing protein n=1 Tax=Polyplax serrata TaxID=468196 RepID=A0ABR1AG76_POLSC
MACRTVLKDVEEVITGDGKDMSMNIGFQPNGPMCPQMGQPPNMFNGPAPEGFSMNGPTITGFNPGFPMNCDPSMYGPPMGAMGMGGPPHQGHWNRGGGGGGGSGGGWQGGRPFMGPMNMGPKFQKGVCHHFAKFGNCARGSSCRFLHTN